MRRALAALRCVKTKAARADTAGEFEERYGTGSGSDLVDPEVVTYKAPGRYRSLYRTNSPAVSALAALRYEKAKRRGLAALHTLRAKVGSSVVNSLFAAHKFCVKRIFLILFA